MFPLVVIFWILCSLGMRETQACGPMNRFCQCPSLNPCCMFAADQPMPYYSAGLRSVLGGNVKLDDKLKERSAGNLRSGVSFSEKSSKKYVAAAEDLSCNEWDSSCLWRNVHGGALEWYRGSGSPDIFRLKISTGSSTLPRPPYAIVASSQALPSGESAPLISDPIACQSGDGEVRFTYWTSPKVRLTVCYKRINSPVNEYCSPGITGGDSGPAVVRIPGPIMHPFELVLNAYNFVYNDGQYSGGLAMIDDLEYEAQICSRLPENGNGTVPRKPGFLGVPSVEPAIRSAPKDDKEDKDACNVVDCNFHDETCVSYVEKSDFHIHQGHSADNHTRPGWSTFVSNGEFAFVVGPQEIAHLTLPPFTLHQARVMRFSYYRSAITTKLRLLAQRSGEREVVIFEAPETETASRRWIQESIPLKAGKYEKVTFEVLDLITNTFVGIDEMKLMDESDQPVCQ